MRVQVLSDLHFEFHRDGGEEFVRLLDPTDVDVLVVAVVVTHHLPSPRSVAPQFMDSPINCYFLCDVERLMGDRPKLWVHGHTHSSCDYLVGATRVISNPFGYPREVNHEYVEKLVIDVVERAGHRCLL